MATRNDDTGEHISVSPMVLYMLLGAAGLGGLGGGSFLGPRIHEAAIQACDNHATRAMELSAQNAEELSRIRQYIDTRTTDRWTSYEQREHQKEQDRRDAQQDRRIDIIERQLK